MPDLRTELTKVVSAWDAHEQTIRNTQPPQEKATMTPTVELTGNMSKDTFNYIRDNNLCTALQAQNALEKFGYKRASVSSIITQFISSNLVNNSNGNLRVMQAEYTPVKSYYKRKGISKSHAAGVAKVKAKAEHAQGIAALTAEPTPVVKTQWDADTVINNMGIKEAHKLYLELNTYFGGAR